MASEYSLKLKAMLDTSQISQELNRLRNTYLAGGNSGGGGSGVAGTSHLQKIEVQLTKLNQSIVGLQRVIEGLNRIQARPQQPMANVGQRSGMPIAPSQREIKPISRIDEEYYSRNIEGKLWKSFSARERRIVARDYGIDPQSKYFRPDLGTALLHEALGGQGSY
ncbi:hypothetical protein [Fibrobacter sp.]|uniref:hypothetical protein n=1 Tax=Fibrobacter sp. TaxID=35828 RepID=UPI00389037C1